MKSIFGTEQLELDTACCQLIWPGKRQAILEAEKTTTKTLLPVPEESLNWDTTANLYIEGDNLEVLRILLKSHQGTVRCIYIDPPYNTGKTSSLTMISVPTVVG